MNTIQSELEEDGYPIQIIGVNGIGYESANERVTEGRDIPWLQDLEETDAWSLWEVQYRDVYILDQQGQLRFIYNLTTHDLANPTYASELTEAMVGLIEEEE